MKHPPSLARLIDALHALPGIGPKSAQRLAFRLLQDERAAAKELALATELALGSVVRCWPSASCARCAVRRPATNRSRAGWNHPQT